MSYRQDLELFVTEGLKRMQGPLGQRFDSNESAIFAKQLEHIYTEMYNVEYPELKARKLIPVDTRVPTGAETFTYRQFDKLGEAKIIHNYAKDFPNVEIFGSEFTGKVKGLGASYQYNLQDLRAAAMAGLSLDSEKATVVREVMENLLEDIAATGDTNTNMGGFVNASGILAGTLGVSAGSGDDTWPNKTPAEILADVNGAAKKIFDTTKGIHMPDTLLLPTAAYSYITNTPFSPTYTADSILTYLLKFSPWIKNVDFWNRLDGAGASSTDRMMVYKKDPRVAQLVISQDFEQFAPQVEGMAFVVPCHMRVGGVKVRYPKAICYVDGV